MGVVQQRIAIKWKSMKTLIAPWRKPFASQISASAFPRVGCGDVLCSAPRSFFERCLASRLAIFLFDHNASCSYGPRMH